MPATLDGKKARKPRKPRTPRVKLPRKKKVKLFKWPWVWLAALFTVVMFWIANSGPFKRY